jgi:hypothetical protein
MAADQLVGLMAGIQLGELRKALELARSNRSSDWLAVRPVFETNYGEIGQSPEFARAFLSSQIVREPEKARRKRVEIDQTLIPRMSPSALSSIFGNSAALVFARNPTLRTRGSHRPP